VPVLVQVYVGGVLFAVALNLLPSAAPLVQRMLSWRPLRMLGLWSYSLYLWQQPAYLYGDGSWTQRVAGLALSIAAGVLSFYIVEQPARRYLNRKWDGAPATLPQRAAA
jgi:peptidoglycan/LPS O-acetylase OafA/YrhL